MGRAERIAQTVLDRLPEERLEEQAGCRGVLARVLKSQGKYDEALAMYQAVLAVEEREDVGFRVYPGGGASCIGQRL